MKALILAAGLGTRLRPFSLRLPKALFPINGSALLDRHIQALANAGCTAIAVNTHHLHEQIEDFITTRRFAVPVLLRHEPQILGTGGAIANLADFWDPAPFVVVNADIVTDMDLANLYRFHLSHGDPVTLALCDDPDVNTVAVDKNGFVTGFDTPAPTAGRRLTFTGVQVLDPQVLDFIPKTGFAGSIDVFSRMLAAGKPIRAYVPRPLYWTDAGTPERLRQAVLDEMVPRAFEEAFGKKAIRSWQATQLAGDGSSRCFFRIASGQHTLILADHGLKPDAAWAEVDAYVAIGRHLAARNVPVPRIIAADAFSGLVLLKDLGDTDIQQLAARGDIGPVDLYGPVLHAWSDLATEGANGFDPAWTCQSTDYDKDLIVDYECRHFVESFLNRYLGHAIGFADLAPCFAAIAEHLLADGLSGLIHRDLQARNVMVCDGKPFFIDFQGARRGPVQYDLASLLIDPYVDLAPEVQKTLLDRAMAVLATRKAFDHRRFVRGYRWCALTRAMQILGAFGRLITGGKTHFAPYVAPAIQAFGRALAGVDGAVTARLQQVVDRVGLLGATGIRTDAHR